MNPLYMALVYVAWFLSTYFIVFFLLMLFANEEKLFHRRKFPFAKRPLVTIIVPAYNEEGKIGDTINSLKRITYEPLEFIIISDGSKDGTSREARAAIGRDKRFRFLDNTVNKGKAACLNEGIGHARGEFVACMDADSVVEPKVFDKTLPYFVDPKVGSVTITVELRNPKTFLHKIIDLEFTIGLSLFLKVFSFFNCVFVTPGPFSIYRKSVLDEIGGFDPGNITEDLEIAYRIHDHGYTIENCMDTKVRTIAPPTFKQTYVQRRRWYTGAIQSLVKHRKLLFQRRLGAYSFFLPFNYTLIAFGLLLFAISTYLSLSHLVEFLWQLQYTGLGTLFNWREFDFDLLRLGRVSIFGFTALATTFVLLFIGLVFTRKEFSKKKMGIVGYPLLFFLYQLWWAGALFAVLKGGKIKWR